MDEQQKVENVVHFAFGGDRGRFDEFLRVLRQGIPQDTGVVLRGSSITGVRWNDHAPFDADGPGTSDLDLTLVGDAPIEFFKITGFFVPGVHSRPMSDEEPELAPDLVPLRKRLMAIAGRPVNIQASREFVMHFRGDVLGQPYLVLIERPKAGAS